MTDFEFLNQEKTAIVIRHFDLLKNPSGVFLDVHEFLDLEQDEAPAKFCATTQIHPLSTVTNEKNVNVKQQMLSRKPAYESWSQKQKEIFLEVCGPCMEKLGYNIPF